jgi:uncharacterized membrane protein YqaE (UPF0057 family)
MIVKFFKYLLTALFPWLYFMMEDNNKAAFICFVLQLTIIGWVPCAIWACSDLKKNLAQSKPQKDEKNETKS